MRIDGSLHVAGEVGVRHRRVAEPVFVRLCQRDTFTDLAPRTLRRLDNCHGTMVLLHDHLDTLIPDSGQSAATPDGGMMPRKLNFLGTWWHIQESLKILRFRYGRKVGFRPVIARKGVRFYPVEGKLCSESRNRELDRSRQIVTGLPGPRPPLFNILSPRINYLHHFPLGRHEIGRAHV